METKLNDNEVREIVTMQKKIDSYEGFINALFLMTKFSKLDMNYPLFNDTGLNKEMNFIWRFIKDKCKRNESS